MKNQQKKNIFRKEKGNLMLLLMIPILITGCFAPVNLNFDHAKTINKGEVEMQGSYSAYQLGNKNYGGRIGYGISDGYTIKFKYERMTYELNHYWDKYGFNNIPHSYFINYFELENKFRCKNKKVSFGIPVSYYQRADWFVLDPRVYLTFPDKSNKIELNIIPKAHIFISEDGIAPMFGISGGFAFSSDLDKWAIRPEIGYDLVLSAGISLTAKLGKLRHY